jgi:hypothetical protein
MNNPWKKKRSLGFSDALKRPVKTEKVTRNAFLYLEPKGNDPDFAQCADCKMFLDKLGICSLHGKDLHIKPTMSCGFFVPGGPAEESELEHVTKAFTPEESGLVDREVRCENCKFMESPKTCGLYVKLNKLPEFSLNVTVKPRACCNAQTPK